MNDKGMNMFKMTEALIELKEDIDTSIEPVSVYDNGIFGKNFKYTIPLFCAENNYICLYQPSRVTYLIFRKDGENNWKAV